MLGAMAAARSDPVLVVNAGSSSLKLAVVGAGEEPLAAAVEPVPAHAELRGVLERFLARAPRAVAVGHRVVHGGEDFTAATALDPGIEERLDALSELAPLHNPPAMRAIRAVHELAPDLPAVACFDTAFHAAFAPEAATYAVPAAWRRRWGLRRFGFHGLSHAWASRRATDLLGCPADGLRLVVAHLGAGASLAAVRDGRSVDTTMGFTPLDGLVMATRSGAVDPGLLLWVQRHGGLEPAAMERALEEESGLLGLSERSGDLRIVLAGADAGDDHCRLALDVYVHRLAGAVAAMTAALGGLDALVFTGGVGERSPRVRALAAQRLGFLGVELDPAVNAATTADAVVSPRAARAAAVVVTAREDLEIARQVRAAIGA
jgi:acetate kinase